MKMGKMDSTEISKSDFDKELTHKFKSSSRSSEEEEDSSSAQYLSGHDAVDNLKIDKDITSVEKPSKFVDSLKGETPSMSSGPKQLTEDFLIVEKLTQLPSVVTTTMITEKFVEEVKEKVEETKLSDQIKATAQEIVTETMTTASKKVESIVSSFETPKSDSTKPKAKETFKEVEDFLTAEKTYSDTTKTSSETKETVTFATVEKSLDDIEHTIITETTSVKDKIKAFTEPMTEESKTKLTSSKDSFEKESVKVTDTIKSLTEAKAQEMKTEKIKFEEEIVSETKSVADKIKTFSEAKVQETAEVKDSFLSKTTELSDGISSKTEKIQSEATSLREKFAETKDSFVSETKSLGQTTKDSIVTTSQSVAETIKSFAEPKVKETVEVKDSFTSKVTGLPATISDFAGSKTEEVKTEATLLREHVAETKDSVVSETKSLAETTKDSIVTASQSVAETIKTFTEPKTTFEVKDFDIHKAAAVDSKTEQVKTESKASVISDTVKFAETTKDLIDDEFKSVAETIKAFAEPKVEQPKAKETVDVKVTGLPATFSDFAGSKSDEVKTEMTSFKEHLTETKDSVIKETKSLAETTSKSVAETIKTFTEPKTKETSEVKESYISKATNLSDTISSFAGSKTEDVKTEATSLKEHFTETKDSVISETKSLAESTKDSIVTESKSVAETMKSFVEPKFDQAKETAEVHLSKAADLSDTFSSFAGSKTEEVKTEMKSLKEQLAETKDSVISESKGFAESTKDSIVTESKSVADTIKMFTEPSLEEIKSKSSELDSKISTTKDSVIQETKSSFEEKFDEFRDTVSKSQPSSDYIITETRTVTETIKSFSEPKVTTSKMEHKFDDFTEPMKGESSKVLDTIRSLSESFDKSSNLESSFDKEKTTIPSTKIDEKIADFEAKHVSYEFQVLEPKTRVTFQTSTEEIQQAAPEAAPRKHTAATKQETTIEESLEKLEEMKSIVSDARKITHDFLNMEQQSQLPQPSKVDMKEETKLIEKTITTTITFPPIVETTTIISSDKQGDNIKETEIKKESLIETLKETPKDVLIKTTVEEPVKQTILDSKTITHDFLNMEQRTQLPYEKMSVEDISELSTETSQHSMEKSPMAETDFEKPDFDARQVTHDFLSMEQQKQLFAAPTSSTEDLKQGDTKRSSLIDEALVTATGIITTISAGAKVPTEALFIQKEATEKKESITELKSKQEQHKDDGIEIAAPVKSTEEMTSSVVKNLTQDFLSFEKSTPVVTSTKTVIEETKSIIETIMPTAPELVELQQHDIIKITGDFLSSEQSPPKSKISDELKAPLIMEPRKSLTDAEFCKSVQESITKKMSEGLIEISDELKMKESEIPDSQTPPPTPIDTKTEKQEEEDEEITKTTLDEDNLIDTFRTLHKTTESTFERVSTISTIETMQEYFPESPIVSVETVTRQGTITYNIENDKYYDDDDVGDDERSDDDDDDDDDDHDKSVIDTDSKFPMNFENVRHEATALVDHVLEESVHIVTTAQDRNHIDSYDVVVDSNNKLEYNSESENYAITCDDIDGLDVVKSPTIESMSGKSFDDNLSFSDEHIVATTTPGLSVQFQQQQTMLSQEPPSLSGDEICGTEYTTETSLKKETGGEISKSTEITPVPPSAITTTTSTVCDTTSSGETPTNDIPKPKPRSAKTSSPTGEKSETAGHFPTEVEEFDVALDLSDDLDITPAPVPKPRSQMKTSDSFKNLAALNDQQQSQSDSVSLRSFDFTEDTSNTEEPSVSISIRSQPLDLPLTTTTTTSEEPATESIDPPSELTADDDSVQTERKTSFYIGESSRNIITKTTPTRLSASEGGLDDEPLIGPISTDLIEATDISLMKEFLVDSDEENDVFKEYVTIKSVEPDADARIRRQSSETRNDLLEEDAKETIEATAADLAASTTAEGVLTENATLRKTSTEQSFTTTTVTSTTSTSSAPLEVIHSTGEDDSIRDISESMDIEVERPNELDLPLEKSEWETTEKDMPPPLGKGKTVHSPQQPAVSVLTKENITEEMVAKTLEEVQQSLDAAKIELKSVLKDGKSIKESPSEFEFRSFSQTIASGGIGTETAKIADINLKEEKIIEENEDISSFIGVPENVHDEHTQQLTESLLTGTTIESLDREAAMLHYAQIEFKDKKPDDYASLGFISTGSADSQDSHISSVDNVVKEEQASLGFISNETAEDFSSMEDYYQEKLAKADVVIEAKEEQDIASTISSTAEAFSEITSKHTMKPFDDVVHRIKSDTLDTAQNRWSVPEIDQSSSSESYYKSCDKSDSRPLSSDIENLITQGNSSEYQTAADVSSVYRETTEFVSAGSTFDNSSGKTISSHESMRSLDSQSETSANLGSIDVSELSETLVASSTDEAEELQRLRDLADEDDSDDSLDIETTDYNVSESKTLQQSQMKRSQEMIFKPVTDDETKKHEGDPQLQERHVENVQIEEYSKPKEAEKQWGLAYPMEETKFEDFKDNEDILLYHGDERRSIDDSKYASSLDEGSILSVSMSSTSNIDTVVDNFEELVGSVGASSLAGIEGFGGSSFSDETTFVMDMETRSSDQSPQDSTATTPPGNKRGHKRSESTAISGDDMKDIPDKDAPGALGEGKESGSESDTDPYETEYARQFRSPSDRKSKKKKQAAAEMDHSFETEKRPFTPSQLVAEVIVEDSITEELEAEACQVEERRPSQNMLNYANIPDITVTEDTQPKSPILEEKAFEEKTLYKVKTEEELHKATDDRPMYEEKIADAKEENFQKLVQEQYKQKLAELQRAEIGDSDSDDNKCPDSPDSFEMVDQPDISDEFVIIEEVAKEANEDDLGGKSIRIQAIKYESKHDEEVEKIITKSAPADPMLGSQIFRDDLNFEFEESPPTASSGGAGSETQEESESGTDMAANNKRWVEMQLTDNQLRYPYDLTGGVLEDIKEEDAEFEVGSSRISSFKDSFSSTPEYDVMAARRYYGRGEHDDISMSSLQEFESLEQAISLENRNRTHQGSTDSSNGSFQRRYILRNSAGGPVQGDDISVSSLKEFEGLENACIEAHLIEIKAKEEAALLSRSDESNKSNGSDREHIIDPSKAVITKVTRTVTHTEVLQAGQQPPDIKILLKQKLEECERAQVSTQLREISAQSLMKSKGDSDRGSIDSLEMNKSLDMVTSSVDDSFDISKDGTTRSDIDSLEVDKRQPTREESIESIEMEQMDDVMSKFGVTLDDGLTTTTTTTTTSTDADGHEHTTVTTRVITKSTLTGAGSSSTSLDISLPQQLTKDISAESLNQISFIDPNTASSAGTTATYQTSAGNSQMSGSITSCASSTLMEDSTMSTSGFTMSTSYWSHEEATVKDGDDNKTKEATNKEHPQSPH